MNSGMFRMKARDLRHLRHHDRLRLCRATGTPDADEILRLRRHPVSGGEGDFGRGYGANSAGMNKEPKRKDLDDPRAMFVAIGVLFFVFGVLLLLAWITK